MLYCSEWGRITQEATLKEPWRGYGRSLFYPLLRPGEELFHAGDEGVEFFISYLIEIGNMRAKERIDLLLISGVTQHIEFFLKFRRELVIDTHDEALQEGVRDLYEDCVFFFLSEMFKSEELDDVLGSHGGIVPRGVLRG